MIDLYKYLNNTADPFKLSKQDKEKLLNTIKGC